MAIAQLLENRKSVVPAIIKMSILSEVERIRHLRREKYSRHIVGIVDCFVHRAVRQFHLLGLTGFEFAILLAQLLT